MSDDHAAKLARFLIRPERVITTPAKTHMSDHYWHENPGLLLLRRLRSLMPGKSLTHEGVYIQRSDRYAETYVIAGQRFKLAAAVTFALQHAGQDIPLTNALLTASERRVLAEWQRITRAGELPTIAEVERTTGYSYRTIQNALSVLIANGYVVRITEGKSRYRYELTERGEQI